MLFELSFILDSFIVLLMAYGAAKNSKTNKIIITGKPVHKVKDSKNDA